MKKIIFLLLLIISNFSNATAKDDLLCSSLANTTGDILSIRLSGVSEDIAVKQLSKSTQDTFLQNVLKVLTEEVYSIPLSELNIAATSSDQKKQLLVNKIKQLYEFKCNESNQTIQEIDTASEAITSVDITQEDAISEPVKVSKQAPTSKTTIVSGATKATVVPVPVRVKTPEKVEKTENVAKAEKVTKTKEYYIQIGTFSHDSSIKKIAPVIEKNNFDYILHVVHKNDATFTKVLIGPYEERQLAKKQLQSVRQLIEPGAFLFHLP
ncbi:MAG: SPOR domain-containing protein [Gammaproteobacteria bacterium]|nr:SPOR domain-containing protein [Gammaproteobacteria bacterium]